MSSKERRFFSGDTLEQTVMQAARYYRVEPGELAYNKLEKRHGFLKVRRGVVIEVDPRNPRRVPEAPEESEARPQRPTPPAAEPPSTDAPRVDEAAIEPASGLAAVDAERDTPAKAATEPLAEPAMTAAAAPPAEAPAEEEEKDESPLRPIVPRSSGRRFPPATGEIAEATHKALEVIYEVASLELDAEVLQGEDRLEIELSGPDEDLLLEDDGALLLAIQHLLPRVIRGFADRSTACRVDCQDFHEIRQEKLRSLAQDVAAEVRRRQRPRMLEPMSPEERRIIHLTLVDDPEVITESQGGGFFKRVRIEPTRRRPQGFDRFDG